MRTQFFNKFYKNLKRLSKKFQTLPDEVGLLLDELEQKPTLGTSIGNGIYKIRLGSKSKGGGKSGGFRVITYYVEKVGDEQVIYLVTIYDKSEENSIKKSQIEKIIKEELK